MSDWFDQEADVNDYEDGHSPDLVVPADPFANVTRFEVIDERGRDYTRPRPVRVRLSYQDGGRTLKVFVGPR